VIRLRQGKTKVLLDVPVIAELRGTLEAAEKKSPTMVVSETAQRPYKVHNFTHRFAEIRDAAGLSHLQSMRSDPGNLSAAQFGDGPQRHHEAERVPAEGESRNG
jgi:hypothetical protein